MYRKLFIATATLMGTIIGAGILGIPYVVAKAGFLTGLVNIIVIGMAVLIVNLYFGEVCLRTKGSHQMPGYAYKYLGKLGKDILTLSMVFGIYGALIAYMIGEGEALKAIFGGSSLPYSLIFYMTMAILVYFGLKTVGKSELIITNFIIILIILISAISIYNVKISNLDSFSISKLFIPYGVVLFAFWGAAAIPEVKELLEKDKDKVKKAILIGSLIPLIVYLLFTFVVVGVIGIEDFYSLQPNERIATVALSRFILGPVGVFANLFAIMAMATSFLSLSIALKEMFNYDYGVNEKISYVLVLIIPLIVFLINYFLSITSFMGALEIAGVITGGIAGVIIVLMFWKAKKLGDRKPEFSIHESKFIGALLILLFLFGIVYEVLKLTGILGL